MKFEKMKAHVVFNLKDGSQEHMTKEAFNLLVTPLVRDIQHSIDEGRILGTSNEIVIDGNEVESFEITNYEELLEYETMMSELEAK